MSGEMILLANPRRRHKRKSHKAKRKHSSRRRHSARRKSYRVRARRNPSGLSLGGMTRAIMPTVKGGAIGAVGGLGNDLLYGYVKGYLPAMLQAGVGRHATKILSAVVVGTLGNLVLKGKGSQLAIGAATVALHEALKEQLVTMAPSLPLGAMDETPSVLGAYMNGSGLPVSGYDDGDDNLSDMATDQGMGSYMDA